MILQFTASDSKGLCVIVLHCVYPNNENITTTFSISDHAIVENRQKWQTVFNPYTNSHPDKHCSWDYGFPGCCVTSGRYQYKLACSCLFLYLINLHHGQYDGHSFVYS